MNLTLNQKIFAPIALLCCMPLYWLVFIPAAFFPMLLLLYAGLYASYVGLLLLATVFDYIYDIQNIRKILVIGSLSFGTLLFLLVFLII